ncbi:hypothetical protein I4Q36_02325 [Tuanshanicoccus lijuaniae]|uniref:hypothetical protein n=1 Tax=Aerococcaceae bacterium zg-1292 TaxID=2774330 RepID=UPI00193625CD|nr:hypothetical protein [Aerococcaceae bacterium zg-1292]MBF6625020.1 hypothetical protein [Aerococcaceae bacterium zg-BR9]MBF6978137.1 hypothetical protein [Aerococcaceae bacterium zg-BR22]MBS4456270.1 hypothetical protein [Aerococcaceae bacterium zg-A91]MBS4458143.1 hypothetical protein [Aerococcaceae bacterium zg-BR33]
MLFKKKEMVKLDRESLLRLLVEQQETIEKQAQQIEQLEHVVGIMDRLSRQIPNQSVGVNHARKFD